MWLGIAVRGEAPGAGGEGARRCGPWAESGLGRSGNLRSLLQGEAAGLHVLPGGHAIGLEDLAGAEVPPDGGAPGAVVLSEVGERLLLYLRDATSAAADGPCPAGGRFRQPLCAGRVGSGEVEAVEC